VETPDHIKSALAMVRLDRRKDMGAVELILAEIALEEALKALERYALMKGENA
jgi:hypothetical protein